MTEQATAGQARAPMRWVGLNLVRLLLMAVILIAFYIGLQFLRVGALRLWPWLPAGAWAIVAALLLAAVMLALYARMVRWFERRPVRELAADGATARVMGGVAIGAALFVLVYLVLVALGVARWHGVEASVQVWLALGAALAAAVGEELVFRGVVFRLLEDSFGTTVALIASAGLFGLVHAGNPGATWISTVAIMLEAGALLGLAYAWSRSLWLPIGLHFGWNFTEGGVFGVAVSGGATHGGLLHVSLEGSALLTGGAFGPEASVVAVGVCLAAAAIFGVAAARAGRWQWLRWRMRLAG
ncbi:MAG TPA: CPBP family intramembrane glutamic endopeptidase [Mizugakiibacter sp.]